MLAPFFITPSWRRGCKSHEIQRPAKSCENAGDDRKTSALCVGRKHHAGQDLCRGTVQWTVTTPLYNIGEHAANLTEDFKSLHPDIPWVKIAGLRHRLVHHYEDTNWTVICAIIYDVLPPFLDALKTL